MWSRPVPFTSHCGDNLGGWNSARSSATWWMQLHWPIHSTRSVHSWVGKRLFSYYFFAVRTFLHVLHISLLMCHCIYSAIQLSSCKCVLNKLSCQCQPRKRCCCLNWVPQQCLTNKSLKLPHNSTYQRQRLRFDMFTLLLMKFEAIFESWFCVFLFAVICFRLSVIVI